MAYATDETLEGIVPDIFEHGIASFEDELEKSTLDIQRMVKGVWWIPDGHNPTLFNSSLLDATQWDMACAYHSLAYHILPKLANFSEGDTFINMMDFYKSRFEEEFNQVMLVGVNYDFDEDTVFETDEVTHRETTRLYR